jgi:hypothetical protein
MKSELLISQKLPKQLVKNSLNAQNNKDAEILAASVLANAFNAEVRWGSRNEDGSKIDLFISYDHPWEKKGERIVVLVQVKSGSSYANVKNKQLKMKMS